MSKIANLYADEIKKHFKILYANWEPGGPLELGNYGFMDGNVFIPQGKLQDDFPEFNGNTIQIMQDPTKDQKEFKSEEGIEVILSAKGSVNPQGVSLTKALLEIKFSKKNSVYFNASGCTTTRIGNKAQVGDILKKLYKNDKWKKEYCVVTDLVKAEKAIVTISQSDNSAISFEADSPAVEKINLADASIKLSLSSEKNIGYKVPADEGVILLMGLCKIKNPFLWWGGGFKPQPLKMTESMMYKMENAPGIKTEESADELIFGQMGKD